MGGGGAGEVRWNKDTQSWEQVGTGGHSAPPPPPAWPPTAPGPGGGAPGDGEPAGGAAAPPTWPQPPSLPPGDPRGRRGRVIAAAVAAAVVVTALATWLVVHVAGDDEGNKAGGVPSSTVGVSQDDETEPSPDASSDTAVPSEDPLTAASESPEVPAGYRPVDDPSGFSTVLPEGWTRSSRDGGDVVFYTSPDKRGLVQIFEVVEAGYTPDDALDVAVDSLSGQPGFTEISRGSVPEETYASELVYEYDSKEIGERVRAVDRVFQTDDGRLYAMVVRGTTDDWARTQETLEIARAAFTPS
ncbi:hypothetical protein [Streptomyces sp. UG1]|uniref:hypothetical protein n=1 Tax=Streptomyces sp. UG1 TaxID=3417652 RepID=UPI003CE72DA8